MLNSSAIISSNNNSNSSSRGEIHLKLHLHHRRQSDIPKPKVLRHHRRLLRALLAHEILNRRSAPHEWRDNFGPDAANIMLQHAVQSKLDRDQTAMAR